VVYPAGPCAGSALRPPADLTLSEAERFRCSKCRKAAFFVPVPEFLQSLTVGELCETERMGLNQVL
jgi:hypothetical protein